MTESRKLVFKETAVIAVGEAICVALMCLIYALIGKFNASVLLGGLVGLLLATGNFFFLAVIATLAADRAEAQDVVGAQLLFQNIKGRFGGICAHQKLRKKDLFCFESCADFV